MSSLLTDTIARRFAVIEVHTIACALLLALLFNEWGGFWAEEPFVESKAFTEVCSAIRVVEGAPAAMRTRLARAALSRPVTTGWFESSSAEARYLERATATEAHEALRLSAEIHHPVRVLHLSDSQIVPSGMRELLTAPAGHMLGVRLQDGSWIVFSTSVRVWGPPTAVRWAIRAGFLCISVLLISVIAARQFARPIKRLAQAVQEFGRNPHAPPMDAVGPQELRQVINTFNEMQARVQKFLSHRTLMLAAISHDLRTPLTRMRLRGELIEEKNSRRVISAMWMKCRR